MLLKNLKKLASQISKAPQTPGVYAFYNKNEKVIYVGKAVKLKSRLKSYTDLQVLDKYPKTKKMVSEASKVKFFEVSTEVEALVLEANLIKEYLPEFNRSLKDDKFYKYIHISKSKNGSLKIQTSRKKGKSGAYFGPYPDGTAVNTVLRDIRRIFPYRNCTDSKFGTYEKLGRPCLYGNIGLCPAPCLSSLRETTNKENIEKIKQFLRGNYKGVIKNLKKEMELAAKNLNYEKAASLRDSLNSYQYLSNSHKSSEELLEGVGDLEKAGSHLIKLIKILSFYLPVFDIYLNKPETHLSSFKIEFYDISNLGDTHIVGSYITLEGEDYNKSLYRRFKIRGQKTQNDFESMKRIIERRLSHIKDWGKPDLIVIDGGKGQLSSVLKATEQYKIPTISIAKRNETIILKPVRNSKGSAQYTTIELPKTDSALKILIKGRNEVHRFGLSYNKMLRSKSVSL